MPRRRPQRTGKASNTIFEMKDIQELIDLLTDRQIAEFEMEQGGTKIRILRAGGREAAQAAITLTPQPPGAAHPAVVADKDHSSPTVVEAGRTAGDSTDELHIIKSPIVGTFYSAPTPDAPPFVKPGDAVKVGQVLCIIEAMKLMNEIESDAAGEVVRIDAENGQPVEYGQSLFAIKPTHKD